MDKRIFLIALLAVSGCVEGGRPHHRGGYGGGGMMDGGMGGQYAPAARTPRTPGTAQADGVLFASFDRDGDLLISAAEVEAGIAREFARADANHDHVVDPAEYRAWSLRALGGDYAPYRTDVDRDHDGQITFEEFSTELRDRAHSYDSNGDGVIEHADLVRAGASSSDDLQVLSPQSEYRGGGDDQGQPRRRH